MLQPSVNDVEFQKGGDSRTERARTEEIDVSLRRNSGGAALAVVLGLLQYLSWPVAVEHALTNWTYPDSLYGFRIAAVTALFPDGPLWLAIVAVSRI